MPQMIVRGPLHVLELSHQHRFQPAAIFHLLGCETLAPASAFRLRQVAAMLRKQRRELAHESPGRIVQKRLELL